MRKTKRMISLLLCILILINLVPVGLASEDAPGAHTHTPACYTLTCTQPEEAGHAHNQDCYAAKLTCSLEEHTHGEGCYDEEGELICTQPQHAHETACYTRVLVCSQTESAGHTHDPNACYVLSCTQETENTQPEQTPPPAEEDDSGETPPFGQEQEGDGEGSEGDEDTAPDEDTTLDEGDGENAEGEDDETDAPEDEERVYTFADETVTVQAYVQPQAGLSLDAKLRAEKLTPDSEAYREAYEKALAAVQLPENAILEFVPYDVYFIDGDARVEPTDGAVRVQMSFARPVFETAVQEQLVAAIAQLNSEADTETAPALEEGPVFAIHITAGDQVERLANQAEETGTLLFTVDSFSIMGPARISTVTLPAGAPAEEEKNEGPTVVAAGVLNAYLYSDGELVITDSAVPESGRTVSNTYNNIGAYTGYSGVPWYNQRTSIKTVTFKAATPGGKVRPASLAYWFYSCSALTTVNTDDLDVSQVTSLAYMFYGCSKLTSVDLSGWNTEKVSGMDYMFNQCSALKTADISGWTIGASVSWGNRPFGQCSALTSVDMSGWKFTANGSFTGGTGWQNWYPFFGCSNLSSVDMSGWNTSQMSASKAISLYAMFSSCRGLVTADLSGWDSYTRVTSLSYFAYNCSSLKTVIFSENAKFENVTTLYYAFYNCSSLTEIVGNSWELGSNVTSLAYAFYYCSALTSLNTSGWNLNRVSDMSYAFYNCSSLGDMDTSGWTLESVTKMGYAFYACHSLKTIDAGGWNTAKVTDMSNAFNPGPDTLILGQRFVFGGSANAFGPSAWIRTGDGASYTWEELFAGYDGPSMADTYVRSKEAVPGSWIYVVLYTDGELVFQNSYETEDGRALTGKWKVDTSNSYVITAAAGKLVLPWYDSRTSVKKITFAEKIMPVNMDYWFYGMTNAALDNSAVFTSENLDTAGLTSMSYTFASTATAASSKWLEIDLSGWNLGKVQNLSYAFSGNRYIRRVDFGNNTLSSATNMSYMFHYSNQNNFVVELTDLDTSAWDLSNVTNLSYAFYNCSNLQSIDASGWNLSAVTTLAYAFYKCAALTRLDTSSWDLSNVTSMSNAFNSCSALTELPGDWNLSAVTAMERAFYGCKNLVSIDTSSWDLSKVTSIEYMFYNCASLTELDTSGWRLTAVTNMNNAFFGTGGLAVVDTTTWNNSKVTSNMTKTFWPAPTKFILGPNFHFVASGTPIAPVTYQRESDLSVYTSQELYTDYNGATMADTYHLYDYDPSGYFHVILYDNGELSFQYTYAPEAGRTVVNHYLFDVSVKPTVSTSSSGVPWYADRSRIRTVTFKDPIQPIYMDGWFYGITNLDGRCFAGANNLDTSKTVSMTYMFYSCSNMAALEIGGWNMSAVTSLERAFYNCSNLSQLSTGGWDLSKVESLAYTFSGCSKLNVLDGSNWGLDNVKTMSNAFSDCSSLRGLDTGDWTLPNVTTLDSTFSGCAALSTLDTGSWSLGNVTTLAQTFKDCGALTALDTAGWELGKVTVMNSSFENCTRLASLGTSGWDTHSVTNMEKTFCECNALSTLDVSGWNVGAVTTMASTFYNCKALKELAVEGWRPAKVTTFNSTFYGCTGLTVLEAGDWVLSAATNIGSMFYGCTGLFRVGTENWGLNSVTTASSVFYNCKALYDIDVSGWYMPKATTIGSIFYGCSSLTELEAGGWGLDSVTGASSAFSGCTSLTTLGRGSWKLTKVTGTGLSSIFNNCNSLGELDVSNWNSSAITSAASSVGALPGLWKVTLWKTPAGTKDILSLGDETTLWFEEGHPGEEDYTFTPNQMRQRNQTAATAGRTYYRICRVTFDPTGGTVDGFQFVDGWYAGTGISPLPGATRRGYDFEGWYTKPEGGEKIEDGQPLWQPTFYAHWREHSYTLILLANDNSGREQRFPLMYSEFFSLSDTAYFTRDFYELVGWSTREDGEGTQYGPNETVLQLNADDGGFAYLYAQWEDAANMVTVHFEVDGGVEVAPIRVKRNTSLGKRLPVTAKDGYTFMGWHQDSLFGAIVDGDTVIRDDITLVAEFQKHRVVNFYLNRGGTGDTTPPMVARKVPYNTALGALPTDPANGKYGALIGWFTALTGGTQVDADTVITTDLDLFGHWGWRPKFNANGGRLTSGDDLPVSSSPLYTITKLPTAEYDGYELVGWMLSDGVTWVKEGDMVDLSDGSEIIAVWQRSDTVKLLLDPNGGTVMGAAKQYMLEVYAGVEVTELPTPTRSGYEFLGWLDLNNPTGGYCNRNSVFTKDTTLQAQWVQKSITITFDRNSANAQFPDLSASTATKKVTIPAGDTLDTLPGVNAKAKTDLEGWYLEGWYPNKDGTGEKLTTKTVLTENATYYAKWSQFRTTETSKLHQYTYGAFWSTASSTHVDNTGSNLNFHPTTDTDQVAKLHVYFQLDNVFGGVTGLPPESVSIKVPKYVFTGWNGENVGVCSLPDQLTEYPTPGVNAFSYIDMGDYYLLVNTQSIAATQGFKIDISYTVSPSEVPGGAIDKDGRYVDGYEYFDNTVKVEFDIDETPEDKTDPDSHAEVDLQLEMHTKVVASPTKEFNEFLYRWDSDWGPEPADADDYFYIRWTLTESYTNSTTQPSTFQWTEDVTVHDGTVVYLAPDSGSNSGGNSNSYTTVITKHPMSLLADIPSTGRTFYNEAIVTETWKSGYLTENRVSASTVLYNSEYTDGEFDKIRSLNSITINGGQEDVLEYQNEVSMPWKLTYDGGSNERPTWDEVSSTYNARSRTIRIQDGISGDLMYSSGGASAKYIWVPNTGNVVLEDEDYYFTTLGFRLEEYDARCEGGVWTDKILNPNTELYDTIDIYVRYKNKTEFELFTQFTYVKDQVVALPKDVVGFEVRHNSEFYWTYLQITAGMKLVPTAKIQALIQSDVDFGTTSIFKNIARCDIWHTDEGPNSTFFHTTNYTGDNQPAQKQEYELNRSDTKLYVYKNAASSTNRDTVYDATTGIHTTVMHLTAWTYNTSSRYTRMTSGTFYDLLPQGSSVDPSTVVCVPRTNTNTTSNYSSSSSTSPVNNYNSYANNANRLPGALVDVTFEENWNGTGRTMMIISYLIDDSLKLSGVPDGINVLYKLNCNDLTIRENSTTVENDVAFVNTTPGHPTPVSVTGSIDDLAEDAQGSYMGFLRQYEGHIGFAKDSTHFKEVSAFSWDFSKTVQTEQEHGFVRRDATLPGNLYTYRLMFGQDSTAVNRDIVFFDVLENGIIRRDEGDDGVDMEDRESQWHGAFQYASVSVFDNAPGEKSEDDEVNPVIYYSTLPRETFELISEEQKANPREKAPAYDLSDSSIWKTTLPSNPADVTAIAVDCSRTKGGDEFQLKGESWIRVDITMKAPVGVIVDKEELVACNEGLACAIQAGSGRSTVEYSDAEVTLREVEPELHKTADPPSGTYEEPELVEQKQYVNYNISVHNTDEELTMYGIVVEDTLPSGMYFSTEEILVYFDDDPELKISIDRSPRASVERKGQFLRFTINSLCAGETIHFVVPAMVIASSKRFENTSEIVEINGVDKELQSETTYHEVVPTFKLYLMTRKALEGNRWVQIGEGEFAFNLELLSIDGEEPPAGMDLSTHCQTKTTTENTGGRIEFDLITYGKDSILDKTDNQSIYLYAITETEGTDPTLTYASEPVYAEVTVSLVDNDEDDDSYGGTDEPGKKITADVRYYTEDAAGNQTDIDTLPALTNIYNAAEEVQLRGRKQLNGRPLLPGDEFTFTAVLVDNRTREPITGADAKTLKGVTVGTSNEIVFDKLKLTQDDIGRTYTFRIGEEEGTAPGVTHYSEQVYYAEISIEDSKDSHGQLVVNIKYYTLNAAGSMTVLNGIPYFDNRYEAEGVGAISGTKEMIGRTLRDGEFTFDVIDAEGNVIASAQNAADGSFTVSNIGKWKDGEVKPFTLSDLGTLTGYKLVEHIPEDARNNGNQLGGVAYDDTEYPLRITVEDKDYNGELTVTVETGNGSDVKFKNTYVITVSVDLRANKVLEGAPLTGDMFRFALLDEKGDILQTVANAADGSIVFKPLEYTAIHAGKTFSYTVVELNDDGYGGVTYDETVYAVEVKVMVTDPKEGTLEAVKTIRAVGADPGETVEAMVFRNSFVGSVTLRKLDENGKPLSGAQFCLYAWDAALDNWRVYDADNANGLYTVDENGLLTVTGLAAGDYYFVETKAPEGYVIAKAADGSAEQYRFTVGVDTGGKTTAAAELRVENLPEEKDKPTPPPKGNTPKTGDTNRLTLWTLMAVFSGGALGVLIFRRKRGRNAR